MFPRRQDTENFRENTLESISFAENLSFRLLQWEKNIVKEKSSTLLHSNHHCRKFWRETRPFRFHSRPQPFPNIWSMILSVKFPFAPSPNNWINIPKVRAEKKVEENKYRFRREIRRFLTNHFEIKIIFERFTIHRFLSIIWILWVDATFFAWHTTLIGEPWQPFCIGFDAGKSSLNYFQRSRQSLTWQQILTHLETPSRWWYLFHRETEDKSHVETKREK